MPLLHPDDVIGVLATIVHRVVPPPVEDTLADLPAYERCTLEEMFPAPARVPVVVVERRWRALGMRSDDVRFPSLHQPIEPHFARRYREDFANQTVWARWIRPAAAVGRPRLVYLHGFMQPETRIEELGILTTLAARLGVEVIQVQPPYHGRRKPPSARLDGELYWTSDVVRSIEALRQSLLDARTVLAWLLDQDDRPVGVTGLSLGGALTAALTCLEPRFAFSAPMIAHMDLGAILAEVPVLEGVRRELAARGFDAAAFGRLFDRFGWRELPPRIPRERIHLFAATDDHFFRREHVLAMWRRWGEPPIRWYPCSHMGFIPRLPEVMPVLRTLVDTVAHAPPRTRGA